MGDSHCSKIAIMQLFHELKQQFPALPDHIISQCIAQNACNRQTCEQSLRETQELRPPLGKFPPVLNATPTRCIANQTIVKSEKSIKRPHRPVSLNIHNAVPCEDLLNSTFFSSIPISEPCLGVDTTFSEEFQDNNSVSDYEVNHNTTYDSVNNFDTSETNSVVNSVPSTSNKYDEPEYSRSYTSVSLILRPPSSKPQVPIEICSQGSSLIYTTSSLDPHGFQSHLKICIGSSNPTTVTAARIKHPMNLTRPNTLTPLIQNTIQKPPGLPTGLSNQSIKPAKTMSAPTTPSNLPKTLIVNSGSLPTTPTTFPESHPSLSNLIKNQLHVTSESDKNCSINKVLTDSQKQLIEKQLLQKNKLAQALQSEKEKLETMKQEIKSLSEPELSSFKLMDQKQKLRSSIYQLQLECDRLANEIDRKSEQIVPLGETNEEFYRSIYTGQKIKRNTARVPPIPSKPPIWQVQDVAGVSNSSPTIIDDEKDERLGPPWICSLCTFANHPLINACEQCNMPRFYCINKPGEMKDIHIRVTHRQNFPSRRTQHSWVV